MTIGDRIKKRREELNISQEELGIRLGYKSRSSINKIELDGRSLPQSKIKAIADALGTSPSYIMGWEDTEHNGSAFAGVAEDTAAYRTGPYADNPFYAYLDAIGYQVIHHAEQNRSILNMKDSNREFTVSSEDMILLERSSRAHIDLNMTKLIHKQLTPAFELRAAHNDTQDEAELRLMNEDLDEL